MFLLVSTTAVAQSTGWQQLPKPVPTIHNYILSLNASNNIAVYDNDSHYSYEFDSATTNWTPSRAVNIFNNNVESYVNLKGSRTMDYTLVKYTQKGLSKIFRSPAGAEQWQPVMSESYLKVLRANKQGHLFVLQNKDGQPSSSIYRSTDFGDTWDPVMNVPLEINDFYLFNDTTLHCFNPESIGQILSYDITTDQFKIIDFSSKVTGEKMSASVLEVYNEFLIQYSRTTVIVSPKGNMTFYSIPAFQILPSTLRKTKKFLFAVYKNTVTSKYSICYSVDNGMNWQSIDSVPADFSQYRTFEVDSNACLYVAASNGIYKSTDFGTRWYWIGIPSCDIRLLQKGPLDDIHITMYRNRYVGPPVLSSTDNGRIWNEPDYGSTEGTLSYFFDTDQDSIYKFELTADICNVYAASKTQPLSFQPVQSLHIPSKYFLNPVHYRAGLFYTLVSFTNTNELYPIVSYDHGRSWNYIVYPQPPEPLTAFTIASKQNMYAGFLHFVLHSDDGGKFWTQIQTPIENTTINLIESVNNSLVFICTLDSGVWLTTPDGLSIMKYWALDNVIVYKITLINDRIYFCTNRGLYSDNIALTDLRKELFVDEKLTVTSIYQHVNGKLYAVVLGYGLWTTDLSLINVRKNVTSMNHISVVNMNGVRSLIVNLAENTSLGMEIYDILGRKVSTLADGYYNAGEISFPILGLPEGVYFARITSPKFNESLKFIISE
jgi:hypothetical protein